MNSQILVETYIFVPTNASLYQEAPKEVIGTIGISLVVSIITTPAPPRSQKT